jgi:SAM-dependent methyltransferase
VHREPEPPSPFVVAQQARLRAAGRLGPLLDLACGRGRHALLAAGWRVRVVALDRDGEALRALAAEAAQRRLALAPLRADAEATSGLPLRTGSFGAVVVTRFLYRPLAPALAALLRPGGILVYETFTRRQRETAEGPRNPAFLLDDGELPRLFPQLEVLELAEGLRAGRRPEWVASLAAHKRA